MATRPDELWVADFTYCSTWSGVVYVAFIIDVFSRRLVGWKASRTMTASLVVDALNMAAWVNDVTAGTISEFGPNSAHFIRTVDPKKSTFNFGGDLTTYEGSLWYLSESRDSLFQLNGTSGKVIRRIQLSSSEIPDPDFVALISGHIWVTSATKSAVAELSVKSGELIRSINAGYAGPTVSVTVNGRDLWLDGGTAISEYNGANGTQVRVVKTGERNLTNGAFITAGGGDIWALNGFANALTELNATNGRRIRVLRAKAGDLDRPEGAAYYDGLIWVVNGASNSVSEIYAATGHLLRNFS